jgi:prepilin-type N-terminal cleavage/methylation domain-containing protein
MKPKHSNSNKNIDGFTQAPVPLNNLSDNKANRGKIINNQSSLRKGTRAGFTLIELLVVISIISLLASMMLVSIKNARLDARDLKRKQDLAQLNTALGLYYDANNSQYPNCPPWTYSTDANWNTTGCLITALKPYLSKLPVDPLNTPGGPWNNGIYDYAYASGPSLQDYDLVAQLENTGDLATCKNKQYVFHYYTPLGGALYGGSSVTSSWCSGTWAYSNYLYADH